MRITRDRFSGSIPRTGLTRRGEAWRGRAGLGVAWSGMAWFIKFIGRLKNANRSKSIKW